MHLLCPCSAQTAACHARWPSPVSGPRESLEVASRHCRRSLLVPQTSVLGDNFRPRGTWQKQYVNARVPGVQHHALFMFCLICFLFFPWTVLRLCSPDPTTRERPHQDPLRSVCPPLGASAASRRRPSGRSPGSLCFCSFSRSVGDGCAPRRPAHGGSCLMSAEPAGGSTPASPALCAVDTPALSAVGGPFCRCVGFLRAPPHQTLQSSAVSG